MKKMIIDALLGACVALAANAAFAQGAIGNGVPQAKQGKAKPPTVQECTDFAAKTDAPKDAATRKMTKACKSVLAKDAKKKAAA
ncbi:hypothetical protein BH11PSE9_BH11PSE9_31010 [soil metagenome]